jgi:hypothetical protein
MLSLYSLYKTRTYISIPHFGVFCFHFKSRLFELLKEIRNRIWPLWPVMVKTREYWMIDRGPGFLLVVWFGSSPIPFPPPSLSRLSLFLSLPVCRRSSLPTGGGGGGARGAKSFDREKERFSINHSILSGQNPCQQCKVSVVLSRNGQCCYKGLQYPLL